jgi:hypothetical protein
VTDLRYLWLILILLGSAVVSAAQPEKAEKTSRQMISEDGWDLKLNLKDFQIQSTSKIEIELVEVEVTHYRIIARPEVTLENGSQCEIRNLRSYKVDGFVFAVEWGCYGFAVDASRGKFYLGCMVQPIFLDQDLDGKFEVRTYLDEMMLPPSIAKKYAPPPPRLKENR